MLDTGIPEDLNRAYGKIMDNYANTIVRYPHAETINMLSDMFMVPKVKLEAFILKHRDESFSKHYPKQISMQQSIAIPLIWNGWCPESFVKGEEVRMRLNDMDFYESEATGLQIAVSYPGVQATILTFRGVGKFKKTLTYADEREGNEYLSPQEQDRPPFCGAVIFKSTEEIERYIDCEIEPAVKR